MKEHDAACFFAGGVMLKAFGRGNCMKRQLQGIALILVSILFMIGFGKEPVFDFDFRWSLIFSIVGIAGVVLTFLSDKKNK